MFDAICDALHHELEAFDEKFASGATMNAQELDTVNKMVHALKSIATYEAMRGEDRRTSRPTYYERNQYRRY